MSAIFNIEIREIYGVYDNTMMALMFADNETRDFFCGAVLTWDIIQSHLILPIKYYRKGRNISWSNKTKQTRIYFICYLNFVFMCIE